MFWLKLKVDLRYFFWYKLIGKCKYAICKITIFCLLTTGDIGFGQYSLKESLAFSTTILTLTNMNSFQRTGYSIYYATLVLLILAQKDVVIAYRRKTNAKRRNNKKTPCEKKK